MPKHRYDDDDDDFDDRPRRRNRRTGKSRRAGPSVALVVGLVTAGVLLLGGGIVAAVLLTRDRGQPAAPNDPFPGMLAHWSFDDVRSEAGGERTVIRDGTGRGNDGVLVGGQLAPGRKGNALWLDGRDDQYVDVSQGKDLTFAPDTELTVAAWFQAREKYSGTIVAFHHPTLATQLDLYVRDHRVIGIIGDDQDTGKHGFVWAHAPTASDGQWHHVALTRRGKFVEVFYDGASQGVDAQGNSGGRLSGGMGAIGCNLRFVQDDVRNFGRPGFRGAIDEVYVFSRALRADEIQALMRR
jgi:hypothetical protein